MLAISRRERKPQTPKLSSAQKRALRHERAAAARTEQAGAAGRQAERSAPGDLHIRLGFSDTRIGRISFTLWARTMRQAKEVRRAHGR
jgi:hypothetical protein